MIKYLDLTNEWLAEVTEAFEAHWGEDVGEILKQGSGLEY